MYKTLQSGSHRVLLLHVAVFSRAHHAGSLHRGLPGPPGAGVDPLSLDLPMSPQSDHCWVSGERTGPDPRAARGHRGAVCLIQWDKGHTQVGAGGAAGMKQPPGNLKGCNVVLVRDYWSRKVPGLNVPCPQGSADWSFPVARQWGVEPLLTNHTGGFAWFSPLKAHPIKWVEINGCPGDSN